MKRFFAFVKDIWKLILLYLLIVITFSYAMFQGGFVSWFLFYSFLPFGFYALALSLYQIQKFEVERELSKHEFNAGESVEVTLTIKRQTGFPLFFIVVEDELDQKLRLIKNQNSEKKLLFPGFQKELKIQYLMKNVPRGEHLFHHLRLKTGDPLGLIEKEVQIPLENRILVYPAYEEMTYRPQENHYDQGMTASNERVQRDTSMATGVREYQPGDRFSWINWKATAKRNDIMTKEFEQRKSHDVFILMDCAPDSRFEVVVSFTASLVRAILHKGAQTGFLSSSSERVEFPIRGGEAQLQQIFYHLAKVKDDSKVTVDLVLESENFLSQQNYNLMLITSQMTKPLIEKASYYSSRKGNVTLFLMKKKKEIPTKKELSLIEMAKTRGIKIKMIHDEGFFEAFSEVKRG
ncbi:DUF58 domain-containing protein [Cytobacillus purgationiresistens]|uniref:Uncharacterized protein (DUF58 family) n=1 Tax=Cytobacillus purgationiresistens TaxID=863449 RepID=A0ABU0APX5_9BACI|nr:DUF58 domain-containing protein [Cytobacillus purgationiresistens]MDQ0273302.1 uncharacterized protein (DUF58 family) [Cytobacillus purgationiresistens]